MNLRKASRAITQLYDKALRPIGLRATQFTILVAVARARDITISTLAEYLVMNRTTLTRNLRPLERKDYITITTGEDRRIRFLSVTHQGQQILQEALGRWKKVQEEVIAELGNNEFEKMLKGFTDVVDLVLSK